MCVLAAPVLASSLELACDRSCLRISSRTPYLALTITSPPYTHMTELHDALSLLMRISNPQGFGGLGSLISLSQSLRTDLTTMQSSSLRRDDLS